MDDPRDGIGRTSPPGSTGELPPPFAASSFGAIATQVQGLEDECLLLRRRVTEIERSNADLEAFAGRAAHELRNALAPVRLGCRLLSGAQAPEVRAVAEAMDRSLHNATTLLDALLVFSRVGVGAPTGESGLGTTIDAVIEELSPAITAGGIDLDREGLDDAVSVECEQGLLHIVLTNVIGNAVKFLAHQDIRRIRVAVTDDGTHAVLSVEDTGPGIPAEAMDRIFEPFFRVPYTGIDGHGLGLATVRRILGACGGKVRVESQAGHGTRVSIELPASRSRATP